MLNAFFVMIASNKLRSQMGRFEREACVPGDGGLVATGTLLVTQICTERLQAVVVPTTTQARSRST